VAGPTIDSNGFHAFGLNAWKELLEIEYRTIFGSQIDLSEDSPDGQWMGILAEHYNDLEQLAQTVYNGRSPAGAVGAQLSRLLQLNGLTRKPAQFSIAPITLTGVAGTVVPINSLIASASDPELPQFKTTTALTIGGGGTVTGQAQCVEAGPVNVQAGDLTVIKSPTTGWTSVTNTSAASPGALVESDPAARPRRARSVAKPSQSMTDSIYAAIADLAGVDDVVVYENDTGAPDSKGLPPHSINVIVDGGVAADIADAIWTESSMGATKVGAQSLVVTDTQGNPHTMRWDLPGDLNVYITVELSRTPTTFESDSIKNALVDWGIETSRIGQNVLWEDAFKPITDLGITGGPGLPSVKAIRIGATVGPTLQDDLVVAYNQRPRYATARISVVGP
jgi:uncharacterized phage protein gp47/JayE